MVARVRLTDARNVAFLVAMAFGPACKSKQPPTETVPSAAPTDHLGPNETAEGRDKAFALALPSQAKVVGRFDTTVVVRSPLTPEELANFVRARVKEGGVITGGASTTFENVIVPAEPQRRLTIDVRRGPLSESARSEMTVRDVTPPPLDPGLTDEQRWKKAGFGADGKPLDPKHVE